MIKQRTESIDIYKKNDRKDLLEVEQKEFDLIFYFFTTTIKWKRKLKRYVLKQ